MKNKLSDTGKMEALNNALISFKFPKKYFLQSANKGNNQKFCIASKSDLGGINTHSIFMSYEETNCYLRGWYDAKSKKFN